MKGVPPTSHEATSDPGPRGRSASAGAEALEEFRAEVHRRLDALEALARERASAPGPEPDRRTREEALRREQEQRALIEQLDHDRRLLAEAWERLEFERNHGPTPSARSTTPDGPAPTRPAPPPSSQALDDPVARAVLRQFESLRRDTRRGAGGAKS